jgi:AraC-like DNA-binding protein
VRIIEEHIAHPGESFRMLRFEVDSFRAVRHRHRQVELTWIEAGAGIRFVGNSVAPFDAGDMVLLGENVPHAWVSANQSGVARASVLQFPPELVAHNAMPELRALAPLIDGARQGLRISGASHARIASLLELLHVLAEAAGDLQTVSSWTQREAAGERANKVDRLTAWIHDNMATELDIDAAADIVHITPAAFSRFFRREFGKTFSAYVNDIRCSEACVLLRLTDRPIGMVAQLCGFNSQPHFHREFFRRTQLTPLQYRRGP